MNYLTIGVLVFVLLSGGVLGAKVSNLNPFSSKNRTHYQKSSLDREEYYKDKIKGIEYKVSERSKNKKPVNPKKSFGQRIGSWVDNAFSTIVWFLIAGFGIFILTGINVFKYIVRIRKTLIQLVRGTERAKTKLNGQKEILKDELSKETDADSKLTIEKIRKGI